MRKQKGFTLIELVVVIMIIGILAAVAAPKLFKTSGAASDSAAKETLSVVRDAIERYAADNAGSPPADPSAAAFISKYLRGSTFPKVTVGSKASDNTVNNLVKCQATSAAEATPTAGWIYNTTNGEFIIDSTAATADATTTYDKL